MAKTPIQKKQPANAGERQANRTNRGQFKPGISGNPSGMTPGSKHKATILLDAINQDDLPKVIDKLMEKALRGNMAAISLLLTRFLPTATSLPTPVEFNGSQGLTASPTAVCEAMTRGELSPSDALVMLKAFEAQTNIETMGEIEKRLAALERGLK
jgi:hypothetical protein